jgi:SagB-type dehydrogenase family enzyme
MLEGAEAAASSASTSQGPEQPPLPEAEGLTLPDGRPDAQPMPLVDCILQRHSVRQYRREGLGQGQLSTFLRAMAGSSPPFSCVVAVRSVEGLDPGIYRHDPARQRLHPLRRGLLSDELAAAALGQTFVGQAPVCIMPVADIDATCQKGGPRAYLDAFFAAGLAGQRAYLAATALGLGTCAVGAFEDSKVNGLACLERDTESVLCLFPVGVPRAA